MAVTVTATQGGSTAAGMALRVFVLTQAAATQNGATSNNQFINATSFTQSITTTQTGSRVYGASAVFPSNSVTAAAATTIVDDIADGVNNAEYVTFKATSLTGTPGATTLGFTVPTSTGPFAQAEIKTAGTLTEDASAPAAVSTTTLTAVTTASFTPPAGSLLVALVASDGGTAVTTMAVTDTGGGYTWIEQVKNNPSAGDYAGVWIAQVPAGGPGYTPQRYGQAAPPSPVPWQQKDRRDANTVATAANPLVPPLDSAWQAGGLYWHLYNDSADAAPRTWSLYQRPLVSDPNLLASVNADPLSLNPEQSNSSDLWRIASVPAFYDRRLVPQQRIYYDPSLLATALLENELLGGAETGKYYRQPATHADRREYPYQPKRDAYTPGLLDQALLENELLGGAETGKYYRAPATHADRREVPQQRVYYDTTLLATAQLENELLGGADTARHAAVFTDRREVPQQRACISDPNLLAPAVPADPTQSAWLPLWLAYNTPAYADRREVPQQRIPPPDQGQAAVATVSVGSGTTEMWWGIDTAYWFLLPRAPSDPSLLATALLENELLGGGQTSRYYLTAAYWDRREVPQQPPRNADPLLIGTALLENELLGGADTARHAVWTRPGSWPAQRPCVPDPNLLVPPAALDPTQSAWASLWLAYNLAATSADRREVPQQRPYISDPSFYPTGAVTDPLTLAWGDDGPYWHLYNRAADLTDRREYFTQRLCQSDPLLLATALLENELLGGAETGKYYRTPATNYARWWMPQQPPRLADPLLIATAQLENELLGGADTARHAMWARPGSWPAQRAYISDPLLLIPPAIADPTLSAWLPLWLAYNTAATYADRREVPQQRPYISDPLLLLSAQLENELLGGAQTARTYNTPGTHYPRWWMPEQPLRLADPLLIGTALLENELLGGAETGKRTLWWRPGSWPQQRLYISDPSFYPTTAPTDPLTLAWGAGGVYWHCYNQPADITDRREVPQQRSYVSDPLLLTTAQLENELLGGAETGKYYRVPASHVPRWWMPEQRAYVSDPLLLTTAQLENELLGGAGTALRYLTPAYIADRREVPSQRQFFPLPQIPLDPVQSAWASLWLGYNVAATHADRRLVPAQRLYFPVPLPPPPIQSGEATVTLTDPYGAAASVGEVTVAQASVS